MSMEAQPALEPCMKVQRIPALTDMREQSLGHGSGLLIRVVPPELQSSGPLSRYGRDWMAFLFVKGRYSIKNQQKERRFIMANDKKLVEAITSMDVDFAQWYTDVVKKAELCDYASVKGCMVIKPAGYAIW